MTAKVIDAKTRPDNALPANLGLPSESRVRAWCRNFDGDLLSMNLADGRT